MAKKCLVDVVRNDTLELLAVELKEYEAASRYGSMPEDIRVAKAKRSAYIIEELMGFLGGDFG